MNTPITNTLGERAVAKLFVEAELTIRDIEAGRKELTVPLNEALKKINTTAKEQSLPMIEIKEELQKKLSDYRLLPEVQEKLARRRTLERESYQAEKAGDEDGMRLTGTAIAELNNEVPKSVTVQVPNPKGGLSTMDVRFRETLILDEIDEEELDDRYFSWTVNEKAIKDDIKLVGTVTGVKHSYEAKPYCVSK